jgi:tRNA dimethylallyltransferase
MKQIAIIAPTASGKTALSIELAHKLNAIILSLDSLSIYKQIDIASAKPTINEREGIIHFGIDEVYPDEQFDVIQFFKLYEKAKQYAIKYDKNLIIVGGTGFYLKAMIDGISVVPNISERTLKWVDTQLLDIKKAYNYMNKIDKQYMANISSTDRYRIQKALSIYKQTTLIPSEYFKANLPKPIIDKIDLYEIDWDIDILRKRIKQRTKIMIKQGVIDEVISLEKQYTRKPVCMGSIGILETLEFLDGKINKQQLEDKISINTAQLAKRQRTFNNGQFKNIIKKDIETLKKIILNS